MFLHLIWDLDDDPEGNVQHATSTGRMILVVYDEIDEYTVYPVTAYDLED
jgi:hypothetical protein